MGLIGAFAVKKLNDRLTVVEKWKEEVEERIKALEEKVGMKDE